MYLLNIWRTGGITAGLFAFAVIVSAILWFQAFKAAKSGGAKQNLLTGTEYDDENISVFRMAKFWLGVAVWVAFILVMWLVVGPDYKGA